MSHLEKARLFHSVRLAHIENTVMLPHVDSLFARISSNNLIIDLCIDELFANACNRRETLSAAAQAELKKTSRLLFLSTLILERPAD